MLGSGNADTHSIGSSAIYSLMPRTMAIRLLSLAVMSGRIAYTVFEYLAHFWMLEPGS